jgi:four helix bundle protein
MATFRNLEEITAWQLARQLCKEVDVICRETALGKNYKLRDQIQGASESIMHNIAEGFGRGGNREFIQFLEIAHASSLETKSQLYRIFDLNYIDQSWFDKVHLLTKRTKGAIFELVKYLRQSNRRGPKFDN